MYWRIGVISEHWRNCAERTAISTCGYNSSRPCRALDNYELKNRCNPSALEELCGQDGSNHVQLKREISACRENSSRPGRALDNNVLKNWCDSSALEELCGKDSRNHVQLKREISTCGENNSGPCRALDNYVLKNWWDPSALEELCGKDSRNHVQLKREISTCGENNSGPCRALDNYVLKNWWSLRTGGTVWKGRQQPRTAGKRDRIIAEIQYPTKELQTLRTLVVSWSRDLHITIKHHQYQ